MDNLLLQALNSYQFWLILSLVPLVAAIILLLRSLVQLKQLRWLSASGQLLAMLALVLLGVSMIAITLNLGTYQQLTHEREAARLHFSRLGQQYYEAILQYPESGRLHRYLLHGDAFQIDAQIIKWHGWLNLLGIDAQYRFSRLYGRYLDITDELQAPRSVHGLTAGEAGMNVWTLSAEYGDWLPWIDASYGSAVSSRIQPNVEYRIYISQSGLVLRERPLARRSQ